MSVTGSKQYQMICVEGSAASCTELLSQLVTEEMKAGWLPWGSPTVSALLGNTVMCQAMVTEEVFDRYVDVISPRIVNGP